MNPSSVTPSQVRTALLQRDEIALLDVRHEAAFATGHPLFLKGFRHYPGGQLVQEIDIAAPVRGARILLTDNRAVRADMTASWLAQRGWEAYVLDGGYDGALEVGPPLVIPRPGPSQRYRRPYRSGARALEVGPSHSRSVAPLPASQRWMSS